MSNSAFARGAHTMNSIFFKPMIRKTYHKKSSGDTFRETMKVDAEEMKCKSFNGESTNANCWIPDERTGIFYPKGQEKVMENIPPRAGNDVSIGSHKMRMLSCEKRNPVSHALDCYADSVI